MFKSSSSVVFLIPVCFNCFLRLFIVCLLDILVLSWLTFPFAAPFLFRLPWTCVCLFVLVVSLMCVLSTFCVVTFLLLRRLNFCGRFYKNCRPCLIPCQCCFLNSASFLAIVQYSFCLPFGLFSSKLSFFPFSTQLLFF